MGNTSCYPVATGCNQFWDMGLRPSGPQLALRVCIKPNVSQLSIGARLTGFDVDDEIAILKLELAAGFDTLDWRMIPQLSHSEGNQAMSATSRRPPPDWLIQETPRTGFQKRHNWRATALACDPNNPERLVETVCLVQAAKEPSDRIASTYSDNLKDAWNTASYANRFNLHVTQQHGKADTNPLIAVQVCIPVVCEVIASTTPHWLAAGDFVTVCAYPQQEVQKFIFDGNEPFQDVPQAFFHYAAATSGGKDIVWDLQGCREQNSGTYLLVDPVVRRRPPATVRNLFFATVGNERGLGKVSPNPKQIDLLHPKCTRLCETFDPERLAAYGKGAGFACFQ
ncbi:unnamed protein product [Polarella glacialis]|uniref:Alpha-type protein kinase domain-containing protein n=1 Tax=Polarella glacialis TaxID=89957 RepID=A0A813GLW6_POLGL|nr:unnamed protein product [Polarella glacialis]